jgi:hypothetical protein
MTAKQAMKMIVDNQESPALNYAVNYAKAGLVMDENSHEFKVQCLYIVSNIGNWRSTKANPIPKEQIKEARQALKDASAK